MPRECWPAAAKVKALAIAEATSLAEASVQVGVPVGTIKRWRHEARAARTTHACGRTEPSSTSVKKRHPNRTELNDGLDRPPRALHEPVVQQALVEAADYIASRLRGMVDRLYALAEKAIEKTDIAISDREELPKAMRERALPHDRDGAAWLRSLVGVLAQSLEKAQLLAGKPTERTEVLSGDEARERIAREIARIAAAGAERAGPPEPH